MAESENFSVVMIAIIIRYVAVRKDRRTDRVITIARPHLQCVALVLCINQNGYDLSISPKSVYRRMVKNTVQFQ